jgi:adenine-specific DNA-methyltransferase
VTAAGRLELTWANKEMRLLAHDDVSYEWVDPADWRVSEVRLLEHVDEVGDPASGNLLIRGDALHALTALSSLPEVAPEYLGKVRLCYIDPPFNTGQAFQHYDDALEHSVWLTMLRDRLVQIKRLLSPDGSVWVHLDDTEVHRARCVLDEVFGPDWFIGTVIWKKADTLRNDARRFSVSHDYLLVYGAPTWQAQRLPRTEDMNDVYRNPDNDPRGPWLAGTLISPHFRSSGDFEVRTPGGAAHRAPNGTSWRVPRETFDRLLTDNRIWFGRDGRGTPQQKLFLSGAKDRVVDTIWDVKDVGGNRQSKAEIKKLFPATPPFDTPKPERLMQRIIHVSTDPGDLVLDCFAGSGTTAAVAQKMGRRWVTVELSQHNVDTFIRPRLGKVLAGEDLGGVTEAVGWKGGGGFVMADVVQSMFEELDGTVVLAEWATRGELAKAVCAQVRYVHEPDIPFAGRKGRSRLAVIDGMLTTGVVDFLVGRLEDSETLLVYAQALEPGIEEYVREARSGSRAKKVPRDLARSGVMASRLVRLGEAKKS